jgi:hypothetical protein
MWFATRNGLCCFDGYRFTTFRDRLGMGRVLTTNRLLTISPTASATCGVHLRPSRVSLRQ